MGVIENLKEFGDLAKKAGDIPLYRKIVDAEEEVRDLTREKRQLEDKVEELERALKFKEETLFKAPFYYLKEGDQTPYCAACWETASSRQAVHVVLQFDNDEQTAWVCPTCKYGYHVRKAAHSQYSPVIRNPGPWS